LTGNPAQMKYEMGDFLKELHTPKK